MENSLGSLRNTEEWIQFLVDESSFVPLLPNMEKTQGFGDEIVTGFAKVNGRPIALWACRPDVRQGYITSQGAIKIRRLMDRALELGIPIVSLLSSAGVSIDEGVKSGEEYSRVLMGTAELSGQIPQIACVMGVNIGAPAYSAALQDLVLFNFCIQINTSSMAAHIQLVPAHFLLKLPVVLELIPLRQHRVVHTVI